MDPQALGWVGLEGNQDPPHRPSLRTPTRLSSRFLEKRRKDARDERRGAASDALPAAPLLFRLGGRVSPCPGPARTCGTIVATPRGAPGPHGERAGPQGGERSGSRRLRLGRLAGGFWRKPAPAPRPLGVLSARAARNSQRLPHRARHRAGI